MNQPPIPASEEEQARWRYTGAVWRMLYGHWQKDLDARVELQVGNIRKEAWGVSDISACPLKNGYDAVSVMYDAAGKVGHVDPVAAERMSQILDVTGFWPLMQTVQRDTLALREMLLRVDIDQGMPTYRLVYPHWVVADSRPQRPEIPTRIEEARIREIDGKDEWTWDVVDSVASIDVVLNSDGEDITAQARRVDQDEDNVPGYQYTKADGTNILPYSMYHAKATGMLWDAFSTRELYEGTLNLGVKFTFLGHIERKASWPQRYIVGAQVAGVGIEGDSPGTKRASVTTDPSTVLLLDATEDGQQPMIGQWTTTADIGAITEAIAKYYRFLASYVGLDPADIQRTSGDPRSGYALAVSRDSQRKLQKKFEPQFRKADENTLTIVAVLMNRYHANDPAWVPLPEEGYTVTYRGVPLSADEKKAMLEDHKTRIEAGTLDRVTAYMEQNPGVSEAEAAEALERIRRVNARFG